MANSMFVTSIAIIAVVSLMTAVTLSVGIAFAQPVQPPGLPFSPPGPPFSNQQLQVRQVEDFDVHLDPGMSGNSQAECDLGEVATGGGFVASSGNVLIGFSTPSPDGWQVGAHNPGDNPEFFRATAVCAKLVNAP